MNNETVSVDKYKRYRIKLKSQGLCDRCGEPAYPYANCDRCRDYKLVNRVANKMLEDGDLHPDDKQYLDVEELAGFFRELRNSKHDKRLLPRANNQPIDIRQITGFKL